MTVRISAEKLEEWIMRPGGGADQAMNRLGHNVMTNAKALLSNDMVNVRTGLLRASINYRVVYDGPTMSVFIGSNVDYAGHVHKGTAPHIIRGHGKMLSFYWPKAGKQMVLPFVRHPGTAPRPYLTEALRRSTLS